VRESSHDEDAKNPSSEVSHGPRDLKRPSRNIVRAPDWRSLCKIKDDLISWHAEQAIRTKASADNALDVVLACDDKMAEFKGDVLAGKRPARQ
jgi:hypothetical protein